jgi:hypothetical protein
MVMRWCAALAIVLGALLVVTAKVGRVLGGSHRLRPPAIPVEDSRAEEPAPVTPPPPTYRPQAPPRPISRAPLAGRRERTSVAHLHGRVLLSSGGGDIDDLDDLQVDADDGLRLIHARLSAGGRFSFHLPPGRYTLSAESGDLAGTTLGVLAGADQEPQEIDIRLSPAATIRGTVRGPAGAEITLRALPVGGLHPARPQSVDDDGKFALPGLIPGRRYDLTFFGPAIRETTVRSIAAPVDRLEVVVAALPIVRGAIGFPPGETCPIETVSLHGDGIAAGDDQPQTEVDAACRFELTPPESASGLTVVAEGPGWRLEESLAIPAQGDPEPICFNPPCRADQQPDGRIGIGHGSLARVAY